MFNLQRNYVFQILAAALLALIAFMFVIGQASADRGGRGGGQGQTPTTSPSHSPDSSTR